MLHLSVRPDSMIHQGLVLGGQEVDEVCGGAAQSTCRAERVFPVAASTCERGLNVGRMSDLCETQLQRAVGQSAGHVQIEKVVLATSVARRGCSRKSQG